MAVIALTQRWCAAKQGEGGGGWPTLVRFGKGLACCWGGSGGMRQERCAGKTQQTQTDTETHTQSHTHTDIHTHTDTG